MNKGKSILNSCIAMGFVLIATSAFAQNWPSSNQWWAQENEQPSMFDPTYPPGSADEVIQQKNIDQQLQQIQVERQLQQREVERQLQQNDVEQKIQQNNGNNLGPIIN